MKVQDFNETFDPKWDKLAKTCKVIGTELNDRKSRFDKSDILEQALQAATRDKLCWVDEEGYDHCCPQLDYKVEMKSQAAALFTRKTKQSKKTVSLKLTNTLQNKNKKKKLEETADDLIILDSYHGAVGRVSYKTAIEHSVEVPDGFKTVIPFELVEILYYPSDEIGSEHPISSYAEQKKKMQRDFIEGIFN